MIKLTCFALLALLAVVAPTVVFSHNEQGMQIEGESVVLIVNSSQLGVQKMQSNISGTGESANALETLFFEARISADSSALLISAVIIETIGTEDMSKPAYNVTDVSLYPSTSSQPIVYSDHVELRWASGDGHGSLIDTEPFPVYVPESGILGIKFGIDGLSDGDQVKVTFMHLANVENAVTASIVPIANISLNPLDVAGISTLRDNPRFEVDAAFSDPETHCELCTMVVYDPEQSGFEEATYVAKEMHLEEAKSVQFWARGQDGGEIWIFKAAGKQNLDGTITYANTTQVTLDHEWQRYKIGLTGANLSSITHLFAFETPVNTTQTIYLKGIIFH
jgi:hypothetical protein